MTGDEVPFNPRMRHPERTPGSNSVPRIDPDPGRMTRTSHAPRNAGFFERHFSEQYFTSSQVLLHFFRQVIGRPQTTQGLVGSDCLFPLKVRAGTLIEEGLSGRARIDTIDRSLSPTDGPAMSTLCCASAVRRSLSNRFAIAAVVVASVVVGPADARDWTTVRIGVDATYKPFTYKTPVGQLTGFDVDIANALCAEMKVKCTYVESSWEGIIPGLRANKFDAIISSMSITDERSKVVDFTDKYYSSPTYLVAKTGTIDGTVAGTKGKRVGVLKASTQESYAKGVLVPAGANVVSYDSTQQSYVDLKSGRLDAVVADKLEGLGGFIDTPDGRGFSFAGPALVDPKYLGRGAGVAVRKTDADLRDRFNAALKTIRANGVWKKVNDKYFKFDIYDDK